MKIQIKDIFIDMGKNIRVERAWEVNPLIVTTTDELLEIINKVGLGVVMAYICLGEF